MSASDRMRTARRSTNRRMFGETSRIWSTKRRTKAFRPVIRLHFRRCDRGRPPNPAESQSQRTADDLGQAPCLLLERASPTENRPVNKRRKQRATWMLVGAGSAMVAGAAMSGLIEGGWRAIRQEEP